MTSDRCHVMYDTLHFFCNIATFRTHQGICVSLMRDFFTGVICGNEVLFLVDEEECICEHLSTVFLIFCIFFSVLLIN